MIGAQLWLSERDLVEVTMDWNEIPTEGWQTFHRLAWRYRPEGDKEICERLATTDPVFVNMDRVRRIEPAARAFERKKPRSRAEMTRWERWKEAWRV